MAASTASAIGRSRCEPSLVISAGARFTSTRFGGRDRPRPASAARTRSRLSATALSARPTTKKAGSPEAICTCTSTGTGSMPEKAKEETRAMLMAAGRIGWMEQYSITS